MQHTWYKLEKRQEYLEAHDVVVLGKAGGKALSISFRSFGFYPCFEEFRDFCFYCTSDLITTFSLSALNLEL